MFIHPLKKGLIHSSSIDSNEMEVDDNNVQMRMYRPVGKKSDYKEKDKKMTNRKRELESIEDSPIQYKKYAGLDDLLSFAKNKNFCKNSYRIMITGNANLIRYIEVYLR